MIIEKLHLCEETIESNIFTGVYYNYIIVHGTFNQSFSQTIHSSLYWEHNLQKPNAEAH